MLNIDPPLVRNANRLVAYSDALFSIVATVMIVPISHVELPEDESLYTSFARLILPKVALFMYTFIVISFYWSVHTRLFEVLENVDEFTVLLNLAFMMLITLLPFTFTLLGLHITQPLAILIFSVTFALISGIEMLFVFYVFQHTSMLREGLRDPAMKTLHRNKMLVEISATPVLSMVAAMFAYINVVVSLVTLFLIIFADKIRAGVVKCFSCCFRCANTDVPEYIQAETRSLSDRLLHEMVATERIEFFSDGVFAIVATLIILDICENNIPSDEMVEKYGSLGAALNQYSTMYLAYAGTFCTVALQWYVHHTLFYYIKEANKLMFWFNQMCLICIGLSPLAFKLTSTFHKDNPEYEGNEAIAIQFNCIVVFMAGLCQALIWVVALFHQDRFLEPQGHHFRSDHYYICAKLTVLPLVSFIAFWPTCLAKNFKVSIFVAMQVGAILLFILLGLLVTPIRKLTQRFGDRISLITEDEDGDTGVGMDSHPRSLDSNEVSVLS